MESSCRLSYFSRLLLSPPLALSTFPVLLLLLLFVVVSKELVSVSTLGLVYLVDQPPIGKTLVQGSVAQMSAHSLDFSGVTLIPTSEDLPLIPLNKI